MAEELRLPPFPDELLAAEKKEDVIILLRGLELPYWIASSHFSRWSQYVGIRLTRRDYEAIGREFKRKPE